MTNKVLTKYESKTLSVMISFLRIHGLNRLADRCERVQYHVRNGMIDRKQFYNGIVCDAAFRAISLACREKNGVYVRDFSLFVLPSYDTSSMLDAEQ